MNQEELRRLYEKKGELKEGEVLLGINNGGISEVACDFKGTTSTEYVGDNLVQGSGNMLINYAFVTAVHENIHMMSANDGGGVLRRGIIVGNNSQARAMNEAFTEYFTYISCGGERDGGGLYPGRYSLYDELMRDMPVLEKTIGRECMKDAYFNNNPDIIRNKIDGLLGSGAWDDMCVASNAAIYSKNINERRAGRDRLDYYYDRMKNLKN